MEVLNESRPVDEIVDNLAYTIGEIVQQIKLKGPLPLYQKNDPYEIDFYGIVERVCWRLDDSFKTESRVGGLIFGDCPDGLIYEKYGRYNHKPLLSLLEETLSSLREGKIKSMEELTEFFASFRSRLLELRSA
jgi:hypothetical protein